MSNLHPLRIKEGNLILVVDSLSINFVDVPESARINYQREMGNSYYIVIIDKNEIQLSDDNVEALRNRYDWTKYAMIGTGSISNESSTSYHMIIWHPIAHKIRELLKLPPKEFSITIGFDNSDVQNGMRGLDTLIKLNPELISSVSPIITQLTDNQKRTLLSFITKLETEFGESVDYDRFRMKVCYSLKELDTCLEILDKISDLEDPIVLLTSRAYIYLQKRQIYNALKILSDVPIEFRNETWESLMTDARYRGMTKADVRKKTIVMIGNEEIEISKNFSWLIPFKLAGSAIPESAEQIRAFEYANIGLIVTVLEDHLPKVWFENTKVSNVHITVPNGGTPTIEEMDRIIENMEKTIELGKAVLVHCGGGKGRTGTVLANFMAKNGISGELNICPQMSPFDAITYVREMRPGSIEDKNQERFVFEYVNHLYENNKNSKNSKNN